MQNKAPYHLAIRPSSSSLDDNDPRWLDQISQLKHLLHRELGLDVQTAESKAGSKGVVESIILALGSAGAFSAAVEIFKAWIARDQTRSISLTVERDGEEQSVRIDAKSVDENQMDRFAQQVLPELFRH